VLINLGKYSPLYCFQGQKWCCRNNS